MDTTKLSALIAAAETGSLSAAARRMGAQLSTISRQIAELEATLATPLLTRTGRGVKPTAAGDRFIEKARLVIEAVEAAQAAAQNDTERMTHLRLSAPMELALRLLPGPLAAVHRQFPRLNVEVETDSRRVSLLEEDFDAAIRLGPLGNSGLIARRLGFISLGLASAPGADATLPELGQQPFVRVKGACPEYTFALNQQKITLHLTGPCQVGTFTEAAEIAAQSHLWVCGPHFTLAPYFTSGRLVPRFVEAVFPRMPAHLVHVPRLKGAPCLRVLGDALAQALSDTCFSPGGMQSQNP